MQASSAPTTPEFLDWFGKSAVVDSCGRPMVMYHGTTRGGFGVFDRLMSRQWRRPSMDNIGSWFSSNPSEDGGASMYVMGTGGAVYPVFLSIQRPKVYARFSDFLADMHRAAGRPMPLNAPGIGSTEELHAELVAQGYDGIEFEQTANGSLMKEIQEMMASIRAAKHEEYAVHRSLRLPYTQKRMRLESTLETMRRELKGCGNGPLSTEFDKQRVFIACRPEQIKSVWNERPSMAHQDVRCDWAREQESAAEDAGLSEAHIDLQRPDFRPR